jgi:hypothetical protein
MNHEINIIDYKINKYTKKLYSNKKDIYIKKMLYYINLKGGAIQRSKSLSGSRPLLSGLTRSNSLSRLPSYTPKPLPTFEDTFVLPNKKMSDYKDNYKIKNKYMDSPNNADIFRIIEKITEIDTLKIPNFTKTYDFNKFKINELINFFSNNNFANTYLKKYTLPSDLTNNFFNNQNLNNNIINIYKKIALNTQYISFMDLLQKIIEIIISIEFSQINNYILYIPIDYEDNIYKSNYWISKIIYYMITAINLHKPIKLPEKIIFNSEQLQEEIKKDLKLSSPKNYNILMCDDCIYSGTQMQGNISVLRDIFSIFTSIAPLCKLYILCGYITNVAYEKIINVFRGKIIIFQKTTRVKNLNEILTKDEMKVAKQTNLIHTDPKKVDMSPIYFEHKLADNLSSLPIFYRVNKLIYNNLNNETVTLFYGSLINSCIDIIGFDNMNNYGETGLKEDYNSCPPVPYKKENYTNPAVSTITITDFIQFISMVYEKKI